MMRSHRPYGLAPSALESNILKLRSFEMILIIFYMESLRRFIIGSIKATDKLRQTKRLELQDDEELDKSSSKILRKATRILLDEGIITHEQRIEFNRLVNYRNTIGHAPHYLTVDVGAYDNLQPLTTIGKKQPSGYDKTMLERVIKMRKDIQVAIGEQFVTLSSFDILMFDSAEKTYLKEIKKLKNKISNQIDKLNAIYDEANKSIQKIPIQVINEAQLHHPKHYKGNGTLSDSGIRCVKMLYDAGATPLAVSHLMKISMVSAKRWR
ncbi:hypothetical protein BJP24_14995 [Aeromonas allosaccharophila]|nr:hypothetical protein BJP24_14995 [Aeromonas allosaccharophila]